MAIKNKINVIEMKLWNLKEMMKDWFMALFHTPIYSFNPFIKQLFWLLAISHSMGCKDNKSPSSNNSLFNSSNKNIEIIQYLLVNLERTHFESTRVQVSAFQWEENKRKAFTEEGRIIQSWMMKKRGFQYAK